MKEYGTPHGLRLADSDATTAEELRHQLRNERIRNNGLVMELAQARDESDGLRSQMAITEVYMEQLHAELHRMRTAR